MKSLIIHGAVFLMGFGLFVVGVWGAFQPMAAVAAAGGILMLIAIGGSGWEASKRGGIRK